MRRDGALPVRCRPAGRRERSRVLCAANCGIMNDWPPAVLPRRPHHRSKDTILSWASASTAATASRRWCSATARSGCTSRFCRPAISRRRSRSCSKGSTPASCTKPCSASPDPARRTPWPTSSRASGGRRWCWRRTRRSPPSSMPSSASSSPTTPSSTSSRTTTTTSRKPTFRRAISTSRRTPASTSTSSRCGSPPPSRCWSGPTW